MPHVQADGAPKIELGVKALVKGPVTRGYRTKLSTHLRVAAVDIVLTRGECDLCHVWRLLRDNGFGCHRPERRSIEREELENRCWKRVKRVATKVARKKVRSLAVID